MCWLKMDVAILNVAGGRAQLVEQLQHEVENSLIKWKGDLR